MQLVACVVVLVTAGHCLAQDIPWEPKARGEDWWVQRHKLLVDQSATRKSDEQIVFVGDSITHFWDESGKQVWDKFYANRHAYNYGIAGDRTENIIYRLRDKEFDGLTPKVTVVMIGTNNIGWNNNVEDTVHGVNETVRELLGKMPGTKMILLGLLPRAEPQGTKCKQVNALIKNFNDDKSIFFLDMWSAWVTPDGKQRADLFLGDLLHPNQKGYEVWQQTMEPLLKKLDPAL